MQFWHRADPFTKTPFDLPTDESINLHHGSTRNARFLASAAEASQQSSCRA
jgi:hypothetical protein